MQKNKKRAYPAFIREDEGMQLVYVPDFAIFTEGHDLVDAIEMARDAIGMTGKAYEEDGKELPEPSDYEEAITRAELIKSDFDYTKGYLTLVDVDFQLFDRSLIGPPKISLILLKILRCFIIQCTKNIVINRGNYENQIFACHLSKLCNIKGSHRVTPPV